MNKQELKKFREYVAKEQAKWTDEDIKRSRKRRAEADAHDYKILNQRMKVKRNNNIPTRPMTDEERRELNLL